jgi:hypothetical protein
MVPLPFLAGVLATIGGWAVWVFWRTPRRRDQAITEAEALNCLSNGFEWHYDHPIVTFLLPDGSMVLLERRFGSAAKWYRCRPDDPSEPSEPGRVSLVRPEPRRAELRARVRRRPHVTARG